MPRVPTTTSEEGLCPGGTRDQKERDTNAAVSSTLPEANHCGAEHLDSSLSARLGTTGILTCLDYRSESGQLEF